MTYTGLSDDAWRRVRACLEEHPGLYVKQEAPTRRFVEAVLWMARAGAPWRMLPAEFGPWNSVYKRFARWQEKGVRQRLMEQLSADGDLEWVMLDSTVVRAHSCAAGAKKAKATRILGVHAAGSPRSSTASPTASATRFASR
jgi:transposase